MRMLDLFSGIGGISLAADWAGIETVAFCEIEPFPQKVLRKNWPDVPIFEDVTKLSKQTLTEAGVIDDDHSIDIICGGYPCQPFSNAGKRQGQADDRHLWPEMFRLVRELRPTWVVGENVAGHISLGLDDVLADLESEGYQARAFVLPAAAVQAPHRRDRVFVVGYSECKRFSRQPRRRAGQVTKNGHSQFKERDMAYSDGERQLQSERYLEDFGRRIIDSSQGMAHASGTGWEEQHTSSKSNRSGYSSRSINKRRATRATQSGICGVLDGLSDWMDGYKWPAGYGQEQYEWEPPRVATGVKDRVGRLKGLGNAVVPHQIYPIFAAIQEIEQMQ